MRKHLIILVIVRLLWTSNLLAQVQQDVNKLLTTKDFVAFKKYADSLTEQNERITAHWKSLRDLTNEHMEGVFYFEESIPDKVNPAVRTVFSFRVRVIATDKKLVFYELSEQKNKKVKGDWEPYYETIAKFKNDSAYKNFNNSFHALFQTNVNETELFVDNFAFGEHCGYAGINPKGRQQIDEFVRKREKANLIKWLQSTNTEMQVYAVDALHQLQKQNIALTEGELKMIRFVTNKKGTMYVCSGCLYSQQEISNVTKRFKFY